MSQERLGQLLGITFQQVQKYERGVNRVSASRLHDIAQILGVEIPYFYEGFVSAGMSPVKTSNPVIDNLLSDKQGVELARAFLTIQNPSLRAAVVNLVQIAAGLEVGTKDAEPQIRHMTVT